MGVAGRQIGVAWVWAMVLFIVAGSGMRAAPLAQDDVLDGRLGGSYASFVELYGPPVDVIPAAVGAVFDHPDYGLLAVEFWYEAGPDRVTGEYESADRALVIVLRAPRDAERSATEPDDGDWTIDEAIDHSRAFLPTDVTLDDATQTAEQTLTIPCDSAALADAYERRGDSGCQIGFVTSTEGTVSFIALTPSGHSAVE
jgi:hypothetical protein